MITKYFKIKNTNMAKISRLIMLALASIFAVSIANAFMYGKDYNDVFDLIGMRGFGWFIGLGLIAAAFLFVFWVWMLIDCLKRDFRKDVEKIAWVLVIIFLQLLGAIIYYFVVKISEKKSVKGKK